MSYQRVAKFEKQENMVIAFNLTTDFFTYHTISHVASTARRLVSVHRLEFGSITGIAYGTDELTSHSLYCSMGKVPRQTFLHASCSPTPKAKIQKCGYLVMLESTPYLKKKCFRNAHSDSRKMSRNSSFISLPDQACSFVIPLTL